MPDRKPTVAQSTSFWVDVSLIYALIIQSAMAGNISSSFTVQQWEEWLDKNVK